MDNASIISRIDLFVNSFFEKSFENFDFLIFIVIYDPLRRLDRAISEPIGRNYANIRVDRNQHAEEKLNAVKFANVAIFCFLCGDKVF